MTRVIPNGQFVRYHACALILYTVELGKSDFGLWCGFGPFPFSPKMRCIGELRIRGHGGVTPSEASLLRTESPTKLSSIF